MRHLLPIMLFLVLGSTLIGSFVATAIFIQDQSVKRLETSCAARAALYDCNYRFSAETGCELYIDTAQWIQVGP
jgi:hypothetical protein